MTEESPELRTAKRLNANVDQISMARDEFYNSPNGLLVRELLLERINITLAEYAGKLRTVCPAELQRIQGIMTGLDLTANAINRKT